MDTSNRIRIQSKADKFFDYQGFFTKSVTVTISETLLIDNNVGRRILLVQNIGGNIAKIGGKDAQNITIKINGAIKLVGFSGALYGKANTGSTTLEIAEGTHTSTSTTTSTTTTTTVT